MENFFTYTLTTVNFNKVPNKDGEDENAFLADLFNDVIQDVGHIQLVPAQDRLRISAAINNEETKTYDIHEPRIEFLRFLFENTNPKAKRALKFYAQHSPDALKQRKENKK